MGAELHVGEQGGRVLGLDGDDGDLGAVEGLAVAGAGADAQLATEVIQALRPDVAGEDAVGRRGLGEQDFGAVLEVVEGLAGARL